MMKKRIDQEISILRKRIDSSNRKESTIIVKNTSSQNESQSLLGKPILNQKVTNGQTLVYNEEKKRWEPNTISQDLSSYVTGTGITSIVKLTQAEYDLLTPVETTLYITSDTERFYIGSSLFFE